MLLVGGGSGRCLGREGGDLMKGISALIKEIPVAPSPLLPREDTVRKYQQCTRKKRPSQNVTMLAC